MNRNWIALIFLAAFGVAGACVGITGPAPVIASPGVGAGSPRQIPSAAARYRSQFVQPTVVDLPRSLFLQYVAAGDFNGDGKPDLAVTDVTGTTIYIALNNGNGSSFAVSTIAGVSHVFGLTTGDVNGDGKLDLITWGSGANTIGVLLGNGDGTFQTPVNYPAGSQAGQVFLGDFNSDGHLDIVLSDGNGVISVLLGNGDGSFQAPYTLQNVSGNVAAVADSNGDGKPDLIVNNFNTHILTVSLGKGNGRFLPPKMIVSGLTAFFVYVRTADFNRDDKLDLVLAEPGLTAGSNGSLLLFLGNGDGTFLAPVSYTTNGIISPTIAVGDFEGNGKIGVAAGDLAYSGFMQVFHGNGDGTLTPGADYTLGGNGSGENLVAADFNGDGRVDIAAQTGNVGHVLVILSEPGNVLLTPRGYLIPAQDNYFGSIVQGDFNGDGKLDEVAATGASSGSMAVTTFLGHGDGTFRSGGDFTISLPGNNYPFAQEFLSGDFNHDGRLDVVVVEYSFSNTLITTLLGQGDGTFSVGPTYTINSYNLLSGAVADFNSDGIPDLALGDYNNSQIDILFGNGDGSFRSGGQITTAGYLYQVATADFNADGKADLAYQDSSGIHVRLGNGDGTFRSPVRIPVTSSFAIGDFNNDGKLDIAYAGSQDYILCKDYSSIIGVSFGNGDGTFQKPISRHKTLGCVHTVAGDFNGDGKLDIVASTILYYGNGDGTFDFAQELTAGAVGEGPVVGDLNGDGALDLVYGGRILNVLLNTRNHSGNKVLP